MRLASLWHKKKKSTDKLSEEVTQKDSFKYRTDIELRFADIDMMGHVNNATYFTYLEMARTKYWQHAINWNWINTGIVIGKAAIEYLKPIYLSDKVCVYVRTTRIGVTSFDLEYLVVKKEKGVEVVCSRGKTVCVAYDYQTKKPAPIPEVEKQKMIAFEQL